MGDRVCLYWVSWLSRMCVRVGMVGVGEIRSYVTFLWVNVTWGVICTFWRVICILCGWCGVCMWVDLFRVWYTMGS